MRMLHSGGDDHIFFPQLFKGAVGVFLMLIAFFFLCLAGHYDCISDKLLYSKKLSLLSFAKDTTNVKLFEIYMFRRANDSRYFEFGDWVSIVELIIDS